MVMDNNLIETTKGNFNSSELLYSSVSIREYIRIISYFINVQKKQKIILDITNSHHTLLFDGPGYSSEIIQKSKYLIETNKEYYLTTTFQCLLQILTSCEMINNEITHFHFSGIDQPLIPIYLSNKTTNIEIPSNIYRNVPCFLYVTVPSGQHVNITILNQSYIGQRTMDCKYGGIAFIENTELSYHDVATICESHNRIISHNRNIISHSSSFTIVTYWYKNYSNMSVSLSVTKTRCQSVQIDICKFDIRCKSHYNVKHCLKYVGPIFQSSNISFNYNHLKSELQYSLRVNQCVIFQFIEDLKDDTIYEKRDYYKYLSHCSLNIKASTFQKPGYTINYMFKGSSRHNKLDNYWHISFRGLNDRFCHKMGMIKNMHCLLRIYNKINCFGNQYSIFSVFYQKHPPFYKISNKSNKTEFLILVETKTPTFDTSFDFELKFARWTPGWMNVMVWIAKATYNSKLQYHTEVIPIRKERMRIKSVIGNPNSILCLYINTSKTSNKLNIVLLLAMHSLIEPRSWRYYNSLQLSWINCFKLSNMFNTQAVSIPGSVTRISVVIKELNNITSEDKLEAFWINNRDSKYTDLDLLSVKKNILFGIYKRPKTMQLFILCREWVFYKQILLFV